MLSRYWVVCVLALCALGARAEFVVNGSFEADTFTVWAGYAAQNGGAIQGWTVSPASNVGLNPVHGHASRNPLAGLLPAPEGDSVCFLQVHRVAASVSQTIQGLTPGQMYTLSLRYSSRGGSPLPGQAPALVLSVDGTVLFTKSPVIVARAAYHAVARTFTAKGTTAIITITNDGKPGDNTLLIDDVRVTAGDAVAKQHAAAEAQAAQQMRQAIAGLAARVDLPDKEILAAYQQAAVSNVLPAMNPKIFFGYFSVCADGLGHGYGSTFPALDGHQMSDALLWLGQRDVVQANFDYVRARQRQDGQLPFCIGKDGGSMFEHWVKGNPLRALAVPTYVQNADIIVRYTQDRAWLTERLPSINRAADYLASLVTPAGRVGGAGYYVEMPTRSEYDGVTQGHAVDTFRRVAALNALVGQTADAQKYTDLAARITANFRTEFWVKDHFAEYIHPERGVIAHHGLTDSDWCAIATGIASSAQIESLWPQLRDAQAFYYGGIPTAISTKPETYEDWETVQPGWWMERASMGRVWYLEAWARARMGDGAGLADTLRRVAQAGRASDYCWPERYFASGPGGQNWYCEYPANLIRIVQRFLLGVTLELDGTVTLAPTAPAEFWQAGFGQRLAWTGRALDYRMQAQRITGTYTGQGSQRLRVRLQSPAKSATATLNGRPVKVIVENGYLVVTLPAAAKQPCRFVVASH